MRVKTNTTSEFIGSAKFSKYTLFLKSCKVFTAKVGKSIAFILSNFRTPDKPILHIFLATILFSDSAIQLFVWQLQSGSHPHHPRRFGSWKRDTFAKNFTLKYKLCYKMSNNLEEKKIVRYPFVKVRRIQPVYLPTLHKFEVWGPWKVPQMWHSPFKPNLYVDYGSMIHFAVTTLASEMSPGTDTPFCPCSTGPLRLQQLQQN